MGYVDWVDRAEFEQLRSLSLIDERPAFDVIVCRSREEVEKVEQLVDALTKESFEAAREILSQLEEAQVSLPESEVGGGTPLDSRQVEIGERLLFVVDSVAGEGDFLPRIGLCG